jgi:hypothetical protein
MILNYTLAYFQESSDAVKPGQKLPGPLAEPDSIGGSL